MIKIINSMINKKIKLFNIISFIFFITLIRIFNLDVGLNIFPANLIFFMSFTNVLLVFYKSETIKKLDDSKIIKDFKALVLSAILISLLSVFIYLIMMFISNKILNIINLAVTLTLIMNVIYASLKLLKVSNLLTVERLKE